MTEAHKSIIDTWSSNDSHDFDYFRRFDTPERLAWFWADSTRFHRAFESNIQFDDVLEIACGIGRHAQQIVDRCKKLTLLDTSVAALEIARERFSDYGHVDIVLSEDGETLPFSDARFSSVFSYDAMVHFEPLTVAAYVREIGRVLKPGGTAILHHSAHTSNPTGHFKENSFWRNYMPAGFVAHVASRSGLDVASYEEFGWSRRRYFQKKTDALSVLIKRP